MDVDRVFFQDALAERMERYARASGHPRLVEMLSRYANDQKDKFTLSDDEDQVTRRIFLVMTKHSDICGRVGGGKTTPEDAATPPALRTAFLFVSLT